jgi:hypothetical protein
MSSRTSRCQVTGPGESARVVSHHVAKAAQDAYLSQRREQVPRIPFLFTLNKFATTSHTSNLTTVSTPPQASINHNHNHSYNMTCDGTTFKFNDE